MSRFAATEQSLHDGVRTRIRDALGVALALPNVEFTPPRAADDVGEPWVRLSVIPTGRRDETIGLRTLRGVAVVSVFVPVREGVGRLNDLVDGVIEAFEAGDMGDVQFERVEPQNGTDSGHPGWFMRNVHAHFWVEEQ